jgi:hypothetical protein
MLGAFMEILTCLQLLIAADNSNEERVLAIGFHMPRRESSLQNPLEGRLGYRRRWALAEPTIEVPLSTAVRFDRGSASPGCIIAPPMGTTTQHTSGFWLDRHKEGVLLCRVLN